MSRLIDRCSKSDSHTFASQFDAVDNDGENCCGFGRILEPPNVLLSRVECRMQRAATGGAFLDMVYNRGTVAKHGLNCTADRTFKFRRGQPPSAPFFVGIAADELARDVVAIPTSRLPDIS